MNIEERFIKYTTFDTQSAEDSQTVPSTPKQLLFARFLREEMEASGLLDVVMDDMGYLYGTLPSNMSDDADIPVIGFISHYDTSPDCSGANVKARIIRGYDGNDIELSSGIWSRTQQFPELAMHKGEDLIVTDGTTLLGADDKAGIAEIMHAVCWLQEHPEVKHGKIRIAFNPDEEIGMGAHHFDVKRFACDFAYTIDGGDIGELEYENFNAASAKFSISGVSVHPGYAKDKMINAARICSEIIEMIPKDEVPEETTGYEGFYHLTGMEGSCEKGSLSFIIRDHDRTRFEERKAFITSIADAINSKYGKAVCHLELRDQYYNMKEMVPQHIIDRAEHAMLAAGVKPKVQPIRGGTDGAQLSFMGLPCPNIFTGAVNFHGPHEFVSIQVMKKAAEVITYIAASK